MIQRKPIGEPLHYRGHVITATLLQPDLLGYIDGEEMPHFYMELTALRKQGIKAIDEKIKEREKKR